MSDFEKEMLREVEKQFQDVRLGIGDEELPDEMRPHVFGIGMAILDALIAIRNGDIWRGEADPQKIAERVLADLGFVEPS